MHNFMELLRNVRLTIFFLHTNECRYINIGYALFNTDQIYSESRAIYNSKVAGEGVFFSRHGNAEGIFS